MSSLGEFKQRCFPQHVLKIGFREILGEEIMQQL
jgi:hypothetical protein